MEPWKVTIIVAVISVLSGSVTAIVNAVIDRRKKDRGRKDSTAKIMAKLDEMEKKLDGFEPRLDGLEKAQRITLHDRISWLASKYCEKGEVSYADYEILKQMHEVYHNNLHGNGFLDAVMEDVDALPKVR